MSGMSGWGVLHMYHVLGARCQVPGDNLEVIWILFTLPSSSPWSHWDRVNTSLLEIGLKWHVLTTCASCTLTLGKESQKKHHSFWPLPKLPPSRLPCTQYGPLFSLFRYEKMSLCRFWRKSNVKKGGNPLDRGAPPSNLDKRKGVSMSSFPYTPTVDSGSLGMVNIWKVPNQNCLDWAFEEVVQLWLGWNNIQFRLCSESEAQALLMVQKLRKVP